jgi:UDP-N-acetylmuramoyl-tripeptide--D-alanyl-D-alanine ligase
MTAAMMQLQSALQWLPSARLVGGGETTIDRVHSDTRTIEPGDLFVALKGEKFDANAMLHEAGGRGAAAVLCHADAPLASYPQGLPRIEVPDTRLALGQLAAGWRAQFGIGLIAVTGSNGKTTVTQMLAAILQAHAPAGASLATIGNLNNDIGVPLTLLRLRPMHRIAVVELGMNHPGEIVRLAEMAQPTVALVNNAQREHLEFMHSVEAVARENGSVIEALGPSGVAVFPAGDPFSPLWQALSGARKAVRFGMHAAVAAQDLACQSAQWREGAWDVHVRGLGEDFRFRLRIAGRHNVGNALAAAASALAAGIAPRAIVQGLEAFVPVKGRSRALALSVHGRPCTLVDDTYNANPDSVHAAIEVLAELPGPRLLVLGDMGEVGTQGPMLHLEAVRHALASGIEQIVLAGELFGAAAHLSPAVRHFETVAQAQDAVLEALPQLRSLLVKGSRFMRMERVVDAVCAAQALQENFHAAG